ncbi:MAG: hypothetical protein ACI8YQ_003271 [Polaribacter sp.]|jgi:hypothetical protein
MKKVSLLFAVFSILYIGSCGSDDTTVNQATTNLDMVITASFGGEVLQMQKEYTLCDGKAIRFSEVNLFVSDMVLLKESDPQTAVTELKEIDFLDFTFTDSIAAAVGSTISIQQVPVGTYSGLRLGLGVIADLNRTNPADYGSTSPLSKSSHYWAMTDSYIFAKVTGFADLNGDGVITQGGADTEGFTYHIGSDPTYGSASIIKQINLEEGVNGQMNLNLDFSSVFETSKATYDGDPADDCLDIATYKAAHTDDLELATDMMANLANSITLEF